MAIGSDTSEVVGRVGHLLRFFVAASRARSVVAVQPDAGAMDILSRLRDASADTGHPVSLRRVEDMSDVRPDTDVVYLGPGASGREASVDMLVISASADAVPDSVDRVVARARTGPSGSAPGLWLSAKSSGFSETVRSTIQSIDDSSRAVMPTQPMPADAGRLLHVLARARNTRRAVELGASAGAATLWLASALTKSSSLTSIEKDSARFAEARRNVKRAGLEDIVELQLGEAERLIPGLPGSADLLLLDEDPEDRSDHIAALMRQLRSHALVVAHGGKSDPDAVARYKALVRTTPKAAATVTVAEGHGLTLTLMA